MSVAFQMPVLRMPGRAIAAGSLLLLAASPLALAADPAPAAGAPTALVEDVSDGVDGVQPMDYLAAGRSVALKAGQTLTLSYLESCVNETITGGSVTVGARESAVEGGSIDRHTLPCDGGKLLLASNEAGKAGVTVFRSAPIALPGMKAPLPKPDLTLFKTHPVLILSAPGPVTIDRLDVQGIALTTVNVPGTTLDTAKKGSGLEAGGLYKVSAGQKSFIVKIDEKAAAGGGPALGRLIRF
ncbi:hypothetical protein TSH7_33485 [Azospirillum sp. TSH7]|uniref:hypothetical protein n=1 Tax=unclassified Azospirillum TaxID=2630922 RepID=UPI000D61F86F|nr:MULTISPECIES: hypothetical protein [unclassified Azospirillum]PWC52437.1 hypothetical protein TSH7_33485 [Azospirillum sp. TSH7]PWC57116.1 hypothetical protein TSH20_31865 [Azospirillum sp. TSH20]